jgi:hypothetical protein
LEFLPNDSSVLKMAEITEKFVEIDLYIVGGRYKLIRQAWDSQVGSCSYGLDDDNVGDEAESSSRKRRKRASTNEKNNL